VAFLRWPSLLALLACWASGTLTAPDTGWKSTSVKVKIFWSILLHIVRIYNGKRAREKMIAVAGRVAQHTRMAIRACRGGPCTPYINSSFSTSTSPQKLSSIHLHIHLCSSSSFIREDILFLYFCLCVCVCVCVSSVFFLFFFSADPYTGLQARLAGSTDTRLLLEIGPALLSWAVFARPLSKCTT
jgi:hypothetical protein